MALGHFVHCRPGGMSAQSTTTEWRRSARRGALACTAVTYSSAGCKQAPALARDCHCSRNVISGFFVSLMRLWAVIRDAPECRKITAAAF